MVRRVLALLVVGALVLVGCSDDGGDDAAPGDTEVEATSDADPNGVVSVGYDTLQSGVEINVDPLTAKSDSLNNDALWAMVHGRLLRPTLTKGEGGEFTLTGDVESDLAESVEIIDPETIEIELKEGLTFSDGSVLDAAAVKASYEAVIAAQPENNTAYLPRFYDLRSIEVVSPTSLTLRFAEGAAPSWYDQYADTFASSVFKLTPQGAWDATVTSGPFTVAQRVPGGNWTLEKNPEYWNAENVKLAGIELVSIRVNQPQAALAALQSGQVDVAFTEPALISSITGDLGLVTRVSPNIASMMHICKAEGPLADARIRRAINMGIDREAISEAVYSGTAQPMYQSWPEGHRLYNPEVGDELAYDPAQARQLVEEAGYGDGVDIDVYPIQAFNLDEVAEVMKAQLEEIGITLNIVPTTDYVGQFMQPDVRAIGIYPSSVPGPQKLVAWTGDSMGNICDYSNPEMTDLVAQLGEVSQSTDEAADLWHQVTEISVGEALSGFIVFRSDLGAVDTSRIGDMQPMPYGNFMLPDPTVTYVKAGS